MTANGPRRVVIPGYCKPTPRIFGIRDTSGSMSATDEAIATREVERIAKKMGIKGDDFMIMDVDATVQSIKKYKGRNTLRAVHGRGGTSMTVGIEAIWSMKDNLPDVIVVLTDGGTDWPAEEGPVPVVAAIIPQGNGTYAERYAENVPDWIHTIVVEPAEDPAPVAA